MRGVQAKATGHLPEARLGFQLQAPGSALTEGSLDLGWANRVTSLGCGVQVESQACVFVRAAWVEGRWSRLRVHRGLSAPRILNLLDEAS